jgi:flagellar assembly protein FliH
MTKAIIKKENISFGNKSIPKKKRTHSDQPLQVEIRVPRGRLEQELALLKKEMLEDVESLKKSVETEKESLLLDRSSFEQERDHRLSEVEKLKQQAKDEGYKAGYQEGESKGLSEGQAKGTSLGKQEFDIVKGEYVQKTKDLFSKIIELNDYKSQIFEKTEPSLIALVESIVKKVVSEELRVNPELILNVIRNALQKLTEFYKIEIKVSPSDAEFIRDNKDTLVSEFGVQSLEVTSSDSISSGGCVIETDYGLIDASLETKLLCIMEVLNATFQESNPSLSSMGTPSKGEVESVLDNKVAETSSEEVLAADEVGEESVEDEDDDLFDESFDLDDDLDDDDLTFLNDDDFLDDE